MNQTGRHDPMDDTSAGVARRLRRDRLLDHIQLACVVLTVTCGALTVSCVVLLITS